MSTIRFNIFINKYYDFLLSLQNENTLNINIEKDE